MLRWLIVVLLALVLVQGLTAWLRKIGLGRLPGDLHFRAFGRDWELPLATALLLSWIAALLQHLF
ncbi:DUF2905 domain-containing protein [Malikia sp.]|uniref:DUF2905 domain-containing protein n=1 Tax=Malikia sp. TaxID=2070706 RepID=UPI002631EB84|nr:DUF2905 domain-containing protein [Malikia sp.]MDD2729252.1 DUF2905 domain-containing protein [Malikia sp.]